MQRSRYGGKRNEAKAGGLLSGGLLGVVNDFGEGKKLGTHAEVSAINGINVDEETNVIVVDDELNVAALLGEMRIVADAENF